LLWDEVWIKLDLRFCWWRFWQAGRKQPARSALAVLPDRQGQLPDATRIHPSRLKVEVVRTDPIVQHHMRPDEETTYIIPLGQFPATNHRTVLLNPACQGSSLNGPYAVINGSTPHQRVHFKHSSGGLIRRSGLPAGQASTVLGGLMAPSLLPPEPRLASTQPARAAVPARQASL